MAVLSTLTAGSDPQTFIGDPQRIAGFELDPAGRGRVSVFAMIDKAQLRKDAEQHRRKLAHGGFAAAVAGHAPSLGLAEGAAVAGYCAFREEADPRDLMLALAALGHPLALPCVVARHTPLRFHLWRQSDAMRVSAFGITEPQSSADVVVPSVLLVPLLAFDADGYRLGYGGGYYDRTLEVLRAQRPVRAFGIAYAGQETERLPREAHDQRLDAVLTENGLTVFEPVTGA